MCDQHDPSSSPTSGAANHGADGAASNFLGIQPLTLQSTLRMSSHIAHLAHTGLGVLREEAGRRQRRRLWVVWGGCVKGEPLM